jgi:hypothetical protein
MCEEQIMNGTIPIMIRVNCQLTKNATIMLPTAVNDVPINTDNSKPMPLLIVSILLIEKEYQLLVFDINVWMIYLDSFALSSPIGLVSKYEMFYRKEKPNTSAFY